MYAIYQVLITALLIGLGQAKTIYLISNNSSSLTNENRTNSLTFDEMIENQLKLFHHGKNLTLKLSSGYHFLTRALTIFDFSFVQLIGENSVLYFKENGTVVFSKIDRLTIQSINFIYDNGDASESLSINNTINFSISNCLFSGFSQPNSNSYTLQIQSASNVQLEHVIFKDNLVTALSVINGSEVDITHCIFEENQNGAAKFSSTFVKLSSSNFTKNRAMSGGAVYADTKTHLLISNCMLHGNNATRGGSIYALSSDIHITDSKLTSNNAKFGGAAYIKSSKNVSISNSIVDNNNATISGGGIYYSTSNIKTTDCQLTNNNASFGGAVYAIGTSFSITVRSLVENNTATRFGAGYYTYSSNIKFNDSNLTGNVASQGGAIYSESQTNTSISHSAFYRNSATDSGGAIFARESNTKINNSSSFIKNNAIFGGAIFSLGPTLNTITISDSILHNNNAAKSGGGIFAQQSQTNLINSRLTRNNASFGGAVYANGPLSISLINCAFDNNTAFKLGGGIFLLFSEAYFDTSNLTGNVASQGGAIYSKSQTNTSISHSAFYRNSATDSGGAIFAQKSQTNIINSRLTKNNASVGGAVYANGSLSVSFINCAFDKNTAIELGGGIYLFSSKAFINTCELTHNTAIQGGAIYHKTDSYLSINHSILDGNNATNSGGGIFGLKTITHINASNLTKNNGKNGGAMYIQGPSTILVRDSVFDSNIVTGFGGSIHTCRSRINITNSRITRSNSSSGRGGAIHLEFGRLNMTNSNITQNTAIYGGAVCVKNTVLSLSGCQLKNNTANEWGGGVFADESELYITRTAIIGNKGSTWGGGIYVEQSRTDIAESELSHNVANYGAALYSFSGVIIRNCQIMNNIAKSGALHIQQETLTFRDVNTINYNRGSSLYALDCEVRFEGPATLSNNYGILGGAIYSVQSTIHFNAAQGSIIIKNNTAKSGGGIFLRESTLKVNQPFQCTFNIAQNGGCIFAYLSTLKFGSPYQFKLMISIMGNNAHQDGGGVAAISSTIRLLRLYLYINNNTAGSNGGGLHLQQNSKMQLLKTRHETPSIGRQVMLQIENNRAQFGSGGGVYVNDSKETGSTCRGRFMSQEAQNIFSECFIQTLNLYDVKQQNNTIYVNTFITNNTAMKRGSDVYGGLLDRCTLNPFVEFSASSSGLEYFTNTVEISSNSTIASDPVRVILCNGLESKSIINRGGLLTVHVMAVDQVGNPLNATLNGLVVTESGVGRLKEGQAIQPINGQCTELAYNVFSQDSSATIELHADGPCTDIGASKLIMNVTFLPCVCPAGFQQTNNSIQCSCDCDLALEQYDITKCFHERETIQIETDIWIGIEERKNNSLQNTVHYNVFECPFDYCAKKPIQISLNNSNSINQQCAFNRSGIMCGQCEPGLSLVLGSSKCKHCSNVYLLLLIPFALGGIVLVAFILLLNITVATGTIHGLIFYANVLASNTSLFLPQNSSNFLTVFIHWINLDLGIETCFYDEMNSQSKVLLQLVFPTYLFLLVFVIIIFSKYFNSFAKLLSNRNPVAALGTLILLSYSKFQRFIIVALKYRTFDYPHKTIWFSDGNIEFFTSRHFPQFLIAIFIIILGGVFIILLLFGQLFVRCSEWKFMKWTKSTKFTGFMDVYHAPFTPKHRYWVGLLLLALITQNLVAAFSPNQYLPVLSAGCLPVGIILFKAAFINKVYSMWLSDYVETLFLLNLVILALGTFYINSTNGNTIVLTNTSISISFLLFAFCILGYHFYKFILKKMDWFQQLCQIVKNTAAQNKRMPNRRRNDPQPRVEGNNEQENVNVIVYRSRADGATRADQLRLSYMDELAPVADCDYSLAASSVSSSSNTVEGKAIVVTYTVV